MSAGSRFVDHEYEKEDAITEEQLYESTFFVPVTIRLDATTASILDGLAARFGQSRNSIASEFLKNDALEAFQSLRPKDRLKVAEVGDAAFSTWATKNSMTFSDGGLLNLATVFNKFDENKSKSETETAQ